MGRFIKHILLFSLLAFLGYALFVILAKELFRRPWVPNMEYRPQWFIQTKLEDLKDANEVDLLFLGSSHCYRGFDNRIFKEAGYSSFNLGSSSQTPTVTNLLLKEYLPVLKPKTVIYEVYPECFMLDGLESSLALMSASPLEPAYWPALWNMPSPKLLNTEIYASYRHLSGKAETREAIWENERDIYHEGGFVQRTDIRYRPVRENIDLEFDEKQLRFFEENIALLEKQGAEIIFVYAPVAKSYLAGIKNGELLDEYLANFDYPFLDYNGKLALLDSLHFYDGHHLNQTGVDIFNAAFLEDLFSLSK